MPVTHAPPEEGQTVQVRHKIWEVKSVVKSKAKKEQPIHRVGIECISDESLGRQIEVIWEREIAPVTLENISLPEMEGIDTPEMFNAFITAMRWSSSSVALEDALYAPFKSSVKIEDFQHVPLIRSRKMPLVRMLIADDVGFGKTIEAGLIVQEMIQSHRASSVLVICPAHLKIKWQEEMADKFGLDFKIIDRESIEKMRQDYGPSINPWASFPRLITSLDYAKKEHPRRLIEELAGIRKIDNPNKKPWDILILDEAHNVAPSGQKAYVKDSDKTKLLKGISRYFEHRLFLTATPHNGYRESFTALLELLDELRFSRGTELDPKHRNAVTVRRLKDEILKPDGSRHFPLRILKPRDEKTDPDFYLDLSDEEQELFELLDLYSQKRIEKLDKRTRTATNFVLKVLKKRALSSMKAIRKSLEVHINNVGVEEITKESEALISKRLRKEDEDFSEDKEKTVAEEEALESTGRVLLRLDSEERKWLQRMKKIAEQYDDDFDRAPDSKLKALINWIRDHLQNNGNWNNERLIIFTEYRDTQDYIYDVLMDEGFGERLQLIYGGMNEKERKEINKIFQSPTENHPARILIATDAASEGADFQLYCRNLIHYEIPWNPIRLEQRNGRIDRYGQKAREVFIHHFIYKNHRDSEFLDRIVKKIQLIRHDLGSVSRLISRSFDKHISGEEVDLEHFDHDKRGQVASDDLEKDKQEAEDSKEIKDALEKNRKLFGITEDIQLDILKSALLLEGIENSIKNEDEEVFIIKEIPTSWSECRRFVTKDDFECPLTFYRERADREFGITVVHLNHSLMQRALRIFRSQMWKSFSHERNALKRVTVEQSHLIQKPIVIGWGRHIILGKKKNRLHEGLIKIGASLNGAGFCLIEEEKIEKILSHDRTVYDSDFSRIKNKISPHLKSLEDFLQEEGAKKYPQLEASLKKAGDQAAEKTRELIKEQIEQVKSKLKTWDMDKALNQMRLDLGEEYEDKASDMNDLRIRLDELYEERKTEPKRLEEEYEIASHRTYPIAYQLIVPAS